MAGMLDLLHLDKFDWMTQFSFSFKNFSHELRSYQIIAVFEFELDVVYFNLLQKDDCWSGPEQIG